MLVQINLELSEEELIALYKECRSVISYSGVKFNNISLTPVFGQIKDELMKYEPKLSEKEYLQKV